MSAEPKYGIVYANLSRVMSGITINCETEEGEIESTSFYQELMTKIQGEYEGHGNDKHLEALQYGISQANCVSWMHLTSYGSKALFILLMKGIYSFLAVYSISSQYFYLYPFQILIQPQYSPNHPT